MFSCRLYSSAVFNNDMKDFAVPEIQQKPADGLLLQMKAMNIDKVQEYIFFRFGGKNMCFCWVGG